MRKLRWKLLAAIVALAFAGAFVWWGASDRVTKENYERVLKVKTRSEVEAILGTGTPLTFPGSRPGESSFVWEGGAGFISVTFDSSGKITSSMANPHPLEAPDSALGKALLRLQRVWERLFSQE
jgi:hypothetical protein